MCNYSLRRVRIEGKCIMYKHISEDAASYAVWSKRKKLFLRKIIECADTHKPIGHVILWTKTLKDNLWGFCTNLSGFVVVKIIFKALAESLYLALLVYPGLQLYPKQDSRVCALPCWEEKKRAFLLSVLMACLVCDYCKQIFQVLLVIFN